MLDIGCVAHDTARMQSPQWLHGRLAAVAAFCLGVDIHSDGVDEMTRLGFAAVDHDLKVGVEPLLEFMPFDVIVAGELIEHLGSLEMLFNVAAASLSATGELIVTTPNPWAPHRVRAGQIGFVWENADHVLYAFPSGIAELAERHGLFLAEASTTSPPASVAPGECVRAIRRRLLGRHWMNVGYRSVGDRGTVRVSQGRFAEAFRRLLRPRRRFIGETFLYVIRRGPNPGGEE